MANIAINSNVVDFPVIIEIACVNSPTELLAVKQVYQSLYKHSLEEDLASHTTGDFRKVCKISLQTKIMKYIIPPFANF